VEGQQPLGNGTQVFDPRYFMQGDRTVQGDAQGLQPQAGIFTDGSQRAVDGGTIMPAATAGAPAGLGELNVLQAAPGELPQAPAGNGQPIQLPAQGRGLVAGQQTGGFSAQAHYDPAYYPNLALYGASMLPGLSIGMQRVALPPEMMGDVDEPVYVNAKQYHCILRRRQQRAKAEAENKLIKTRRPYLHESRHKHAMKRPRGSGGRFQSKAQIAAAAAAAAAEENGAKGNGTAEGGKSNEKVADNQTSAEAPTGAAA